MGKWSQSPNHSYLHPALDGCWWSVCAPARLPLWKCPLRRTFDVPSGRLREEGMEPTPAFSWDTSPTDCGHPIDDDDCDTKERFEGSLIFIAEKKQLNCDDTKLLLLLSSSSSSPLCRVFILIFLRQTMSLGNTVLQLFCCYYSWCLYR